MLQSVLAAVAACLLLAAPALAERPADDDNQAEKRWVEVHRETGLWSGVDGSAELFGLAEQGARFRVLQPQKGTRLYVKDLRTRNYAYIDALDVGPSGRPPDESPRQHVVPPESFIWAGTGRVTMYTCVELGGCNRTAMGIWPYEGVVAVDPRLIPLGSTVWLDGLGIFLAADTGSLVRGYHFDVYVLDYYRARQWGIQYLMAAAYWPDR